MMVERHGLQAASTGSAEPSALGAVARAAFAAAVLLCGVAVVSAPAALAQDTEAPAKAKAKAKASKSKAAAKPTDADGDDDAQAAASGKRDPAQAQRSLDSGIKLLQAGKAEQAIQTLSTVISGGNLPPHIMARALYQRGAAYRLASKPAQAVSDLTSALWLKGGLTDSERTDAIQQRSAAYREAGIADQGTSNDAAPAARRTASAPSAVGATQGSSGPAVTTASLAPDGPAKSEQPSPLGNFFSNLFGGSNTSSSAPAPAAPPPAAAPQPAASSWMSGTTTSPAPSARPAKTARAAAVVAPPPHAPGPAASPAASAGSVDARMIMRSEAEANALAGRLTGEFASQLGGRAPAVSQTQFGSMGTFFQVRVGPYKTTAEAQDLCKRIKSTGADCVPVSQ